MTKINFLEFARIEASSYDVSCFMLETDKMLNEIENEIKEEFEELNSQEVLNSRHELFKVENSRPEDYKEHHVIIDDKKSVIVGIRFENCNTDFPFINIKSNWQISSKEECHKLYESFRKLFHVFKPKCLCFHSKNSIEIDYVGNAYMFARLNDIQKMETRIRIEVVTDDYYDWYKKEYELFHQKRPDLSNKVSIGKKSLLDLSQKDGLLYYAKLDGKSIGLIAGEKTDFYGMSAIYFNEIMICDEYKGKGYAKELQNLLLNKVKNDFEIVFGTIDQHNQPSLKTAMANGRKAIRFENFVKV